VARRGSCARCSAWPRRRACGVWSVGRRPKCSSCGRGRAAAGYGPCSWSRGLSDSDEPEGRARSVRCSRRSVPRAAAGGPTAGRVVNTEPGVSLTRSWPRRRAPRGWRCRRVGALGLALLGTRARGPVHLVLLALGNRADVSTNDLLATGHDDEGTAVVRSYMEAFGNPRALAGPRSRVRREADPRRQGRRAGGCSIDAAHRRLFRQAGVRSRRDHRRSSTRGAARAQPLPHGAGSRGSRTRRAGVVRSDACAASLPGLRRPARRRACVMGRRAGPTPTACAIPYRPQACARRCDYLVASPPARRRARRCRARAGSRVGVGDPAARLTRSSRPRRGAPSRSLPAWSRRGGELPLRTQVAVPNYRPSPRRRARAGAGRRPPDWLSRPLAMPGRRVLARARRHARLSAAAGEVRSVYYLTLGLCLARRLQSTGRFLSACAWRLPYLVPLIGVGSGARSSPISSLH